MFQPDYIIQYSTVFVVFLFWFLNSFVSKYFQHFAVKTHVPSANETHNNEVIDRSIHTSSIANERNLLDGFLLLSVGVIFNVLGQGNRTAGDVFSIIIMCSLFLMIIFHHSGHGKFIFGLWILTSLCLLGLFIVPFATRTAYLGYPYSGLVTVRPIY